MNSKSIKNISIEDLLDVIRPDIPQGWEVFSFHIEKQKGYSCVKIRTPYGPDEMQFNEDGYKYDDLFLHPEQTKHYLRLKALGYNLEAYEKD